MTSSRMQTAALLYARLGYAVFPIHEPVFDEDGRLAGCTCEEYRHSDECARKHPHLHLEPDQHCTSPGKCPRVRWKEKSTTDPATIRAWWRLWPSANIGIDCGKSRLVVVDADAYKPDFAGGDVLGLAETVAAVTGGGGWHEWYRQPEGKTYRNSDGLPAGVDVRGAGGYIVAPPSVHNSGARYEFAEGRKPVQLQPAPLPAELAALLDAAEERTAHRRQEFAGLRVTPDLERAAALLRQLAPWRADDYAPWVTVGMALHHEFNGSESALALWDSWSRTSGKYHDGEPRAKWQTFHAGRGVTMGTVVYMALQDSPPEPRPPAGTWAPARSYIKGQSFAGVVPAHLQSARGYRTDATDTRLADAIVDIVEAEGRRIIRPGFAALRDRAGLGSLETVGKGLERLRGWFVELDHGDPGDPVTVALVWGYDVARKSNTSIATGAAGDTRIDTLEGSIRFTRDELFPDYSRHKGADPYLGGASKWARGQAAAHGFERVAQAVDAGVLKPALGESVLRVLDALAEHGAMTRRELVDATGKTPGAVARATLAAEVGGYVEAYREGPRAPKVYSLADGAQAQIEADAQTMVTHWLALERKDRDLRARESWLDRALRQVAAGQRPESERARHVRALAEVAAWRYELNAYLHPEWSVEELRRRVTRPSRGTAPSATTAATAPQGAALWPVDGEKGRPRAGTAAQWAAALARGRQRAEPVAQPTAGDLWRRREYAEGKAAAQANWPALNAWATAQHGPGWWTRMDETDVLGQWRVYQAAGVQP